jgi:hypothetical protein
MNLRGCSREHEIVRMLKDGHWPEGCEPELRSHIVGCAHCREFIFVTQVLQKARNESVQESPAGSASLLWWRAQMRKRNEAAARINRPITIAQTFAWSITVLVAFVFLASQYNHGLHWSAWWSDVNLSRGFHLLSNGSSDWHLMLLIPSLGLLFLLSGVVVYLASEKQ